MKRLGFVFLMFVSCVSVMSDDYMLVWADEFEYEGAPNPADWTFEEGFVRNNEWQWYQSDNAFVRDGLLTITAREEHRANPGYMPESKHWGARRDSIHCTSACVITHGRRSFLYGRIEVRARIPATPGTWPAIWLLGENRNVALEERWPWPYCGEVDMMEYYPRGGKEMIHANACWGGKQGKSMWDSQEYPVAKWRESNPGWTEKFHVWRMDWDKDKIRLYLDDELLNEIDLTETVNGGYGNENPFHRPMYLLLNLAMGSTGGKVDMQTMPARYDIDYVRYYQKQ